MTHLSKNEARKEFWQGRCFQPTAELGETFDTAYEYGRKAGREEGVKDGHSLALKQHGLSAERMSHTLVAEPGYEKLVEVLHRAHEHAAHGKGKERHANDQPFEQQRMLSIARLLKSPPDALAFQVCKKVAEGLQMEQYERKVAELLGAINYIAGIVILLGEEPVPDQIDSHNPQDPYSKLAADFEGVKFESPAKSEALTSIDLAVRMVEGLDQKEFHVGELCERIQRALEDLRKPHPPTMR